MFIKTLFFHPFRLFDDKQYITVYITCQQHMQYFTKVFINKWFSKEAFL